MCTLCVVAQSGVECHWKVSSISSISMPHPNQLHKSQTVSQISRLPSPLPSFTSNCKNKVQSSFSSDIILPLAQLLTAELPSITQTMIFAIRPDLCASGSHRRKTTDWWEEDGRSSDAGWPAAHSNMLNLIPYNFDHGGLTTLNNNTTDDT